MARTGRISRSYATSNEFPPSLPPLASSTRFSLLEKNYTHRHPQIHYHLCICCSLKSFKACPPTYINPKTNAHTIRFENPLNYANTADTIYITYNGSGAPRLFRRRVLGVVWRESHITFVATELLHMLAQTVIITISKYMHMCCFCRWLLEVHVCR